MISGDFANYWKLEGMTIRLRRTATFVAATLLLCAACSKETEEPLSASTRKVALKCPDPGLTEIHKQILDLWDRPRFRSIDAAC